MNTSHSGRHLILPIPPESDLIESIVSVCRANSIKTAVFTVMGSIVSATIGVYDQKQQVSVTHIEKTATEVVSCLGNVTQQNDSPVVTAKIVLADMTGSTTAGHLFSPTIVTHAEIAIQEIVDVTFKRTHDSETGLSTIEQLF